MMSKKALAILLVVSALSIGVCAAQENETETLNETIEAQENVSLNIVETAAAENLTALVQGLEMTNLTETLSGEGPFTVFAPTNEAIAALPQDLQAAMMNNTDALAEILIYHVAPAKLMAADVVNLTSIPTLLEGGNLTVNVTEEGVMVDGAMIIRPDIEASNGVIHVIDSVLIPPSGEEMAEEEVVEEEAEEEEIAEEMGE